MGFFPTLKTASGFIFEGFLAGLFGGQSIQIQSAADIPEAPGEAESGVTGKPITDVMLNNKHYSLKLLGEDTDVKGSFRNMVEHFRKYDHVITLPFYIRNIFNYFILYTFVCYKQFTFRRSPTQ